MPRGIKKPPAIEPEMWGRFTSISKAMWASLYRDLYLQTHGEDTGTAWMDDAEHRAELLKLNGV